MKPTSNQPSNAAFAPSDEAGCARPGVAASVVLALVAAYKVGLSPILGGACRFLPSCSDYMAEAVRRHGAARGGVLGLARLGRCHPFCSGGHDPVPRHLPSWLGGASGGPIGARPR